MFSSENDFCKAFNNVFYSNIELEETELNDDDRRNLYMINDKKKKENNYVRFIVKNIQDNNPPSDTEQLQENYIVPEDNNKLSQKQQKAQLNENNENSFLSKKTTRSKSNQGKFVINQYEFVKKKRKEHDKYTKDNKITKIKSFIFNVLISFFKQFLGKPSLHKIRGKQAKNTTVNFNKKLMAKKIKEILSDTGDDYNEKLLNDLAEKNKDVKPYLESKLEDIFNYLRSEINKEKIEANKIFKILKIPKNVNLDLYTLYQLELSNKVIDYKKIIEGCIKEDFVKLINERKSVNTKRIKKIFKKKNK